jgi:anti-sigma regulatory factor (Ser/Thr protein kinase)/anti-anti-sigma regulatory factor
MADQAPGQPGKRHQRGASSYRFPVIPTVIAELQRALLPAALPVLPHARIAARYQTARDSDAAGGNWFDAIPLGDGTVVLVVGDVPGCGVAAAAAMGRLRTVLGDHLAVGADLTSALHRTDAFAERTPELLAATMTLTQLNPADGALRYATCGHPPPLVLGAAGSARYLTATGAGPLGTGSELTVGSAALQDEDCMLLFSDGLIQRGGSTVADGMSELAMVAPAALASRGFEPGLAAGRQGGPDPDRLCRRTVELMSGSGYADDVTTLAVRLSAASVAELNMSLPAEETSVLRARRSFAEWLTELDAAVEDKDDLMLAVVETITNAIEHAYPPGSRGTVEFRAVLEDDGTLECRVTDHGRWQPPDPEAAYRGHGLMVVGQVVDEISVGVHNPAADGGTVVTLRHRLGRPASISTDVSTAAVSAGDVSSAGSAGVSFTIDLDSDGVVPRATVSGAVDGNSADRFAQRLLGACRGGTLPMIVDMAGITYLASSAVRAIFQVRRLLAAHKQDLTIFAPDGSAAASLLDLVRLPHVTDKAAQNFQA